jgi:hypothetical protein
MVGTPATISDKSDVQLTASDARRLRSRKFQSYQRVVQARRNFACIVPKLDNCR